MYSAFRSLLIVLPLSLSVEACAEPVPLDEEVMTAEAPPAPQGESKWKQAARAATQGASEGDAGASHPGDPPPPVEADSSDPDGATSAPSAPDQPDAGGPSPVTPAPDARAPSPTPPPATSVTPPSSPSSTAVPPSTNDAGGVSNSVDRCPGEGLSLSLTHPWASVSASTTSLHDDSSSATCVSAAGGHDATYRFTSPGDGHVTVTLAPNGYSGALYVREGNCAGNVEVACASGPVLNVPVTVDVPVVSGGVYFVFADQQYGLTQGSFVLTLTYEGK